MLTFSSQPLAVGAIADEKAIVEKFDKSSIDLIELRLDSLGASESVTDFAKYHAEKDVPILITARDPKEGGQNALSFEERLQLLRSLAPYASAIDVELQNVDSFDAFLQEQRDNGTKIILSSHDFETFDHMATIEAFNQARAWGADVAKVAVTLLDPVDLTLFESLLADLNDVPFSLMGMGTYGPASRLLAAQHGSLLNYGYLGSEPTAPGQWPGPLLKQVLAHCPHF